MDGDDQQRLRRQAMTTIAVDDNADQDARLTGRPRPSRPMQRASLRSASRRGVGLHSSDLEPMSVSPVNKSSSHHYVRMHARNVV